MGSSIKSAEELRKILAPFDVKRPRVCYYSTDDPSDKLHLILVPLVSSAGIAVLKISERPRSLDLGNHALNELARWHNLSRKLRCIPGNL